MKTNRVAGILALLLFAATFQASSLASEANADTLSPQSVFNTTGTRASSAFGPTSTSTGVSPAADNSLIVQYRTTPSVGLQTSLSVQSTQSINIASSNGTFHAQIMGFADSRAMSSAESSLTANSNVISVTRNMVVYPQAVPNDPNYGVQWAPAAMNLPGAWDATTGSANTVIAVLDTGVLLTHPDLADNLWTNPVDGSHGYNFVDGNNDPTDVLTLGGSPITSAGHGTHVAGIIAAAGNNAQGVTGVNWHASIMALRVCGPRFGNLAAGCYLDWVLQALQYAYDHGAQVANESFGGLGSFSTAERDMINTIASPGTGLQKGVLVVAAAGNNGANSDATPFYPSGYGLSNLISVGALNPNGTLASFSNYGANSVDVLAPGVNIYSTIVDGSFGMTGDYGYLSGTSMAAPEVTGEAALIYSIHPTWSPQQIKRAIVSTSTWTPSLAPSAFSGGIVNAQAALASFGNLDSVRLHFDGTGIGSLSLSGGATCVTDCNQLITPLATLSVTGSPNSGSTMFWQGACSATLASNPCSFTSPVNRPTVSALFSLPGGSGIPQVPLYSSPDSLAAPLGSGPYGSNFVGTAITPSGNYRLKISHYFPPPVVGGWCTYASSTTGAVTVEDNLSGTWTEEAKFTTPALGDFNPSSAGVVHWAQISNCQSFGYDATISDDGKTILIPLDPYLEVTNWADPTTDFLRCGVMVYKKDGSNVWDSGSLIEPASHSSCFNVLSRTATGMTYQQSMGYSSISGDGTSAVISGISNQIFTVNLSLPTPTISNPFTLPNSCVSWNATPPKISKDGTLILLSVGSCSDNATVLLLANNGSSLSLIKSFTDIPSGIGDFPFGIALSGDSQTVAITTYKIPRQIYIYEKRSGNWNLARTLNGADGLTSALICSTLSFNGDRLLCGDSTFTTGYVLNAGMIETIDRISSSWSLGQPIPSVAWSDSVIANDNFQLAGSNGSGTVIDSVVGSLRLGDGTYATNYFGQTYSIPTQIYNNTVLPLISGVTSAGSILSATAGTWSGFTSPLVTYQWYSCPTASDSAIQGCTLIAGANTSSYTPVSGDVGKFLRIHVMQSQSTVVRQVFSTASNQILTGAQPAPTITSVSPASGSTSGGTSITITGTGFLAGASVTIGGASAAVGAITATTIALTTPAGTAGAKDIVVTNSDLQSGTGTALFTYATPLPPPPAVTSVSPTSGSTSGGTSITITGTGFMAGASVTIGGVSATVGVITATTIAATTPAGTAGAKDIVVTNSDTQSGTGAALFTYTVPPPPAPAPPPPPAPIIRVTPIISWVNPASITSDTPLSDKQLNATLDSTTLTTGVFAYTPGQGALLSAGTQTLSVTFTPTDLLHFFTATKTVSIIVTNPPIALTPSVLSQTATYDGNSKKVSIGGIPDGVGYSVTYNGSSNPPINAGIYNVSVHITNDGYTGSAIGIFTINRLAPKLTWNNPAPITSDLFLSSLQLNATSDIPGTFTYTPSVGTQMPIGNDTLSALFVPDDQVNYLAIQFSIGITVNPPITKLPSGALPPLTLTTFTPTNGSTKLTPAQIKVTASSALKKGSTIQIWSYVTPTKNPAADQKLSLTRANDVKAQLLKSSPKATFPIKAMGATIQPSCVKSKNLCVIVKVVG